MLGPHAELYLAEITIIGATSPLAFTNSVSILFIHSACFLPLVQSSVSSNKTPNCLTPKSYNCSYFAIRASKSASVNFNVAPGWIVQQKLTLFA